MAKKQNKKFKLSFSPSPVYVFMLVLILFAGLGGAMYKQNRTTADLKQEIENLYLDTNRVSVGEDDETGVPLCERRTSTASYGGSGIRVKEVTEEKLVLEGAPDMIFCPQTEYFDAINGGNTTKDAIKPGSYIWYKAAPGNYLKLVEIVKF